MQKFGAHRALAFHDDALGGGARDDGEVGSRQMRRQIGLGGAPAFAIFLRHLGRGAAKLGGAVVVPGDGHALFCAGLQKRLVDGAGATQVAHIERATGATVVVGAKTLVVLGSFKKRKHVGVRPAGVALGCPVVVVQPAATGVDHGIDGTAAPQHLAARLETATPVQARLRHRLVVPVVNAERGGGGKTQRRVDEGRGVGSTGFEQANAYLGVLGQAAGHDTTTGAPADHDVIKFLKLHWGLPLRGLTDGTGKGAAPGRKQTRERGYLVRKSRYLVANFP